MVTPLGTLILPMHAVLLACRHICTRIYACRRSRHFVWLDLSVAGPSSCVYVLCWRCLQSCVRTGDVAGGLVGLSTCPHTHPGLRSVNVRPSVITGKHDMRSRRRATARPEVRRLFAVIRSAGSRAESNDIVARCGILCKKKRSKLVRVEVINAECVSYYVVGAELSSGGLIAVQHPHD